MIYNTRNLSNDTTESQKEKLLVLKFFTKTKAFVLIKLFLIKKKRMYYKKLPKAKLITSKQVLSLLFLQRYEQPQ